MDKSALPLLPSARNEGLDSLKQKVNCYHFLQPKHGNQHTEVDKQLDLVTNAGVLRTTKKATIPGWGLA